MYIWVGIDVDEQLQDIKKKTVEAEEEIGFLHSNFTLPLHISLKISFSVSKETFNCITKDILGIYQNTPSFYIDVSSLDYEGNIAWIRMADCPKLKELSLRLNQQLKEKYGIPLHEYDLDYKFHTTLFMDDDPKKVKMGYENVKDCPLPSRLLANRFVVGVSEMGALGTYHIHSVYETQR